MRVPDNMKLNMFKVSSILKVAQNASISFSHDGELIKLSKLRRRTKWIRRHLKPSNTCSIPPRSNIIRYCYLVKVKAAINGDGNLPLK